MAMAAPRPSLSVVRSRADLQSSNSLAPSAFENFEKNGDRRLHQSAQVEDSKTAQPDDPWTRTFEAALVQAALDNLFDGVLIVNCQGDIIRANRKAKLLLERNIPANCCPEHSAHSPTPHPLRPLLNEIWRVCSAVIDSRTTFPDQDVVLDSAVSLPNQSFRIRARWMNRTIEDQPCLIVSIEDLLQTAVHQVNSDRWKYKLTPSETKVWWLKRRGYSYRSMAQTLYVSENTVKKHLKNIQAKRRVRGDFD